LRKRGNIQHPIPVESGHILFILKNSNYYSHRRYPGKLLNRWSRSLQARTIQLVLAYDVPFFRNLYRPNIIIYFR
jgi:hypothetical protein